MIDKESPHFLSPEELRARIVGDEFLSISLAWKIQNSTDLEHNERCSSVEGWHPMSGPAFLCNCGAVDQYYDQVRLDEVSR
jgi:hypothetical protein